MNSLCIDARWLSAGGLGRYLKNVLEALCGNPHFSLSLLHFEKDRHLLEKFNAHLIRVRSLPYSLDEQIELPLKIPHCDLFWSPHFNIPLLPIKAAKRLMTLHDAYHLAHFSKLSTLQKFYAQIFYNAGLLLSDQTLTVSQFSQQEILKRALFKPKKFDSLSNAVSLEHFQRVESSETLEEVRKRLKLPPKFILAITNFKSHKNTENLLEAFEKMETDHELVLVGEGEKEIAQKKVHVVRFVADEDLPSLYTLATCLVFPSTYEGFGFPPLEAMACGTPVAASRISVIEEVCGECVEYFDPTDLQSICRGVNEVLENGERRLQLKALGPLQAKRYDLKEWKEQICEILSACCNSS